MRVLIIGSGSLALCYAHWLGNYGHHATIFNPWSSSLNAISIINECRLDIDGHKISRITPNILVPQLTEQKMLDCDIWLLVATPEKCKIFIQEKRQFIRSMFPIVVLTSWHDSYHSILEFIDCNILPVYPVMACESWQGQLVAHGTSWLELDDQYLNHTNSKDVTHILQLLGFTLKYMPMKNRFRARFATTSFAYSYIRSKAFPSTSFHMSGFDTQLALVQLGKLLSTELDLLSMLQDYPRQLSDLWTNREITGNIGWILRILMQYKLGKTDYFIHRLPLGSC
jgi:hypothetical protein